MQAKPQYKTYQQTASAKVLHPCCPSTCGGSTKVRPRRANQFFRYTIKEKHALHRYKITSQGIILCASKSICIVLNWSTNVAFSTLTSVKNKNNRNIKLVSH